MGNSKSIEVGQLNDVVWPNHGPYSPERALSAATAIHSLDRYLNYAARARQSTLPHASSGYHLMEPLAGAAQVQPQLYEQLARWADSLASDPTLRHSDLCGDEIDHATATMNAVAAAQSLEHWVRSREGCEAVAAPAATDSTDADWLAAQLANFSADDLRRAAEVFARLVREADAHHRVGAA